MAIAKKVTKLLVICRQCDLNLPQRVPTTPEGKNSEVWDTQLSSKRPLECSPSPNEPSQKKIATPSNSSFSTPHKAIAPKALFFATPSSKSKSKKPPMARELKALLSQLEEWQMALPEAALWEDLEEARGGLAKQILALGSCHGWVEEELFFGGKARSKETPLDAMEQEAFQQLASRARYNLEGFDALTVATGGRPKVFLNVPFPQKMDVGDRQIRRRALRMQPTKVKIPYRGPLLVRQNLADFCRPGGPIFFRLQMPAGAPDYRLQNRFWQQDHGEQFK